LDLLLCVGHVVYTYTQIAEVMFLKPIQEGSEDA
jgi:hypothetical protein